jgi:hypothetical protein
MRRVKSIIFTTCIFASCQLFSSCSIIGDHASVDCGKISDIKNNGIDGETYSVCGYLKYEFENRNVFSSRANIDDWLSRECISLAATRELEVGLEKLNNSFVKVTGTLVKKMCSEDAVCPASCSDDGMIVIGVKKATLSKAAR